MQGLSSEANQGVQVREVRESAVRWRTQVAEVGGRPIKCGILKAKLEMKRVTRRSERSPL